MTPPAGKGATYTCPLHSEIVRDAPGTCPICGMALEQPTATLEEAENPELADMTRRFWVAVALTAPLLVVAMGDMLPGHPVERVLGAALSSWIQLALASPVVLCSPATAPTAAPAAAMSANSGRPRAASIEPP